MKRVGSGRISFDKQSMVMMLLLIPFPFPSHDKNVDMPCSVSSSRTARARAAAEEEADKSRTKPTVEIRQTSTNRMASSAATCNEPSNNTAKQPQSKGWETSLPMPKQVHTKTDQG